MRCSRYIILCGLQLCLAFAASAQYNWGASLSYGGQEPLQVDYRHQAYLIKGQMQRSFDFGSRTGGLLSLEPQLGYHRYRPVDSFPQYRAGYEYGLELGLAFRFRIGDSPWEGYVLFRTGSQYVAGLPSRQAAGWLFSSGFMLGTHYWWQPRRALLLRLGFRHWSNAGWRQPNGGIDHALLEIGLLWRAKATKAFKTSS